MCSIVYIFFSLPHTSCAIIDFRLTHEREHSIDDLLVLFFNGSEISENRNFGIYGFLHIREDVEYGLINDSRTRGPDKKDILDQIIGRVFERQTALPAECSILTGIAVLVPAEIIWGAEAENFYNSMKVKSGKLHH